MGGLHYPPWDNAARSGRTTHATVPPAPSLPETLLAASSWCSAQSRSSSPVSSAWCGSSSGATLSLLAVERENLIRVSLGVFSCHLLSRDPTDGRLGFSQHILRAQTREQIENAREDAGQPVWWLAPSPVSLSVVSFTNAVLSPGASAWAPGSPWPSGVQVALEAHTELPRREYG